MKLSRIAPVVAVVAALAVTATGCAKSSTSGAAAAKGQGAIAINFTDDGCTPSPASVPAGALTFTIANKGANRVTEAEILQNGRILGEKENLTPGLSGSFSLRLAAGSYVVNCPNAKTDQATLTVTAAGTATAAPTADASLTTAVASYRAYLESQAGDLLPATKAFAAAVKAGDIAKAKTLFAPARWHYEAIEPVAESFGDLDPEIDARVNDVASPSQWTGFHRIEKALWQDDTTKGMGPMADKLVADVTKLVDLMPTAKLQAASIANGAVDLLGEVANSKITGEEDRYSHTDLWDFEANVAGARECMDVLAPALKSRDPQLLATANAQFSTVLTSLAKYQTSGGYVTYTTTTVPQDQRRLLTTQVNALAETLSKVAPAIV